jgi:hypothetical protein
MVVRSPVESATLLTYEIIFSLFQLSKHIFLPNQRVVLSKQELVKMLPLIGTLL